MRLDLERLDTDRLGVELFDCQNETVKAHASGGRRVRRCTEMERVSSQRAHGRGIGRIASASRWSERFARTDFWRRRSADGVADNQEVRWVATTRFRVATVQP